MGKLSTNPDTCVSDLVHSGLEDAELPDGMTQVNEQAPDKEQVKTRTGSLMPKFDGLNLRRMLFLVGAAAAAYVVAPRITNPFSRYPFAS